LGSSKVAGFNSKVTATLKVYAGQLPLGPNTITAFYSGDSTVNGSVATVTVTAALPASGSAVVPSVTPNPIYQQNPDADGYSFFYTVRLTEMAGVATTLTGFTINGANNPISLFNSTSIPAKGSINAPLRFRLASVPSVVTFGFSGMDTISGVLWSQQISVQFYPTPFYTSIGGVSNAASGDTDFAPGMILSVYGNGLASSLRTATSLPLPATLGNVTATVNGVAAPFYFVSSGQVNVQIPYETATGNALLELNNNGNKYSFSFAVSAAAPGIFTDTNLNTVPYASGTRGQTLTLFITGDGKLAPALATGASPSANTPVPQLPRPVLPVTMTIGGVPASISFIGVPYGVAGATQINFVVPDTAPFGKQQVVVTVGTAASSPASFTVNR
jgi:uncharacterized protein (TIGR03437 family)